MKLKVTFIYTRHKDSLQPSTKAELMPNPIHNFPSFFVSLQSSLVWYFSTINVIYSFFLLQWALKEKKGYQNKTIIRAEYFNLTPESSISDQAKYVNFDTLFQN